MDTNKSILSGTVFILQNKEETNHVTSLQIYILHELHDIH
jgi:hypothetical protein